MREQQKPTVDWRETFAKEAITPIALSALVIGTLLIADEDPDSNSETSPVPVAETVNSVAEMPATQEVLLIGEDADCSSEEVIAGAEFLSDYADAQVAYQDIIEADDFDFFAEGLEDLFKQEAGQRFTGFEYATSADEIPLYIRDFDELYGSFGITPISEDSQRFVADEARVVFAGMSYFPNKMLEVIQPDIYVVDEIDSAAGIASVNPVTGQNDVVLSNESSRETVVHELAHNLQNEICEGGVNFKSMVQRMISIGLHPDYTEDKWIEAAHDTYQPSRGRIFGDVGGMKNESEDWATIITDTLTTRGMILEGDPDWGSIYQQKQHAVIKDVDNKFPGFTDWMQTLRDFYRANPRFGLRDWSKSPIWGDFCNFIPEIEGVSLTEANLEAEREITDQFNGSGEIEFLNNATLVHTPVRGEVFSEYYVFIVNNPIVLRDGLGEISHVGGVRYISDEPLFWATPFDDNYMTLFENSSNLVNSVVTDQDSGFNIDADIEIGSETDLIYNGKVIGKTSYTAEIDSAVERLARVSQDNDSIVTCNKLTEI